MRVVISYVINDFQDEMNELARVIDFEIGDLLKTYLKKYSVSREMNHADIE